MLKRASHFFSGLALCLALLRLAPAWLSPTLSNRKPALGAGFRYSTYGPRDNPGPQYWESVGQQMASRFPGGAPGKRSGSMGELQAGGSRLSFPGQSDNPLIQFTTQDLNEVALTRFDQGGVKSRLQVEPGDAPVDQLIRLVLQRYGQHPCVIGVGVDVEWYHSTHDPQGIQVSDADAAAWLAARAPSTWPTVCSFKHWETSKMPPILREGILFVDDSQQFQSLDQMVAEFTSWGQTFYPAPVAFQFGYPDDRAWWGSFADPANQIGQAISKKYPTPPGCIGSISPCIGCVHALIST